MNQSNRSSNSGLLPLIIFGGIFIVVGGLLISQLTPSIFPDQASAESEQIDTLFTVLMGIGGAIFLLVEGLLVYTIIRFRKRVGDEEDGPPIHGNVMLEVIWTAIPAVIVLVLVIYSYTVWVDIREPKDDETIINVTAQRFAWTFTYGDPLEREDPRDDPPAVNWIIAQDNNVEAEAIMVSDEVETSEPVMLTGTNSDLHVYVGQSVLLQMGAVDVIHSFWVPELRVKQDLIPGRMTEVRFTIIAPEGYESEEYPLHYNVVCAELCGSGHGTMGLVSELVIWETEEDWEEALEAQVFDSILNPPADPVEFGGGVLGSGTFACSGCHELSSTSDAGTWSIDWTGQTGPSLQQVGAGAAGRASSAGLGSAEEYLYRSIFEPSQYAVPGYSAAIMPVHSPVQGEGTLMSTTQVYNIVGFLCSLGNESLEESDCDMENLQTLIEADYPEYPIQFFDASVTPDAESTPDIEMTAETEVTPDVENTPETEATPEAEETPESN